MVQYRFFALLARTIMVVCAAGLAVLTCSGWSGAAAQVAPPAGGHRQPKAIDAPKDSPQNETSRSPEDIALERALNNICRGCSPMVPVRDVPRYDIARTCPPGQGNETCRNDEETVRQNLQQQWTQFTPKSRSNCVQQNQIGGRPSYVQLGICLKGAQIAPTLPEGRQ